MQTSFKKNEILFFKKKATYKCFQILSVYIQALFVFNVAILGFQIKLYSLKIWKYSLKWINDMFEISAIKLRLCLKYEICIIYRYRQGFIMIPAYCNIPFYVEANICFGFRVLCIICIYLNIWIEKKYIIHYIKNIWSCYAMEGNA